MKPITGKLMRNGKEEAPYALVFENDVIIITLSKNDNIAYWYKYSGYSFVRDQWQVRGKETFCNGLCGPYTILAETNKFWILIDCDGDEKPWEKAHYNLHPFIPTPATHEFDGDTYDYQAVKERLSSLKPITTILLLLCLLITGCTIDDGTVRKLNAQLPEYMQGDNQAVINFTNGKYQN